jgi:molybdate transport system permease protein
MCRRPWRRPVSSRRSSPRRLPLGLAPAVLAAGAIALVVLPLIGLLQRAPWSSLVSDLRAHDAFAALRLSLETSLGALAVSVMLGVPLAWVLARHRFPGRALVTLPIVLAFVAMPFLIVMAEAALRSMDRRAEEAAATLGASPAYRFRRVTLPAVAPALAAGAALTWARALGEFGATITFAGNFPGTTQTTPLLVFLDIESGHEDTALALSLVLLAVSLAVLVGLRDRWLGNP